jgi:hypothetical protein
LVSFCGRRERAEFVSKKPRTLIRAIPTQTTLHIRADLIEQVAAGLDEP